MKLRDAFTGGLPAILGFLPVTVPGTYAADAVKPSISKDAAEDLLRMGQTLRVEEFSFQAKTIRVYADPNGEPLHIFHTIRVTVHRPNRLLVDVNEDDGSTMLAFDGKTAIAYSAIANKYASIPVPEGTVEAMMKEAVGRLGVAFPLADFLSEAPNKAFLTGVTSGRVVNTVTIDGAPYDHLSFSQPPGIELELWLSKNEPVAPRRPIVTYRSRPGQPNFIAEFPDWNFNIHPADAEFAFQPLAGAEQVALKPVAAPAPAAKKRRQVMKRMSIIALSALFAISLAPQAFAWGAYHGGFGGGAYRGAWGGGAYHSGAFGTTGVHYGPSGATAYHSGAYGTSAYHTGAYGTSAYHTGAYGTGAYHSGAYGTYGGGAYYHGSTYYGGTAVVTPAYTGWGAAAAGAAVGAAATSAAYAAATTNYYPPPYYQPNALLSASGATPQMRPGAQAVLTECKPDIARFCSQVAPGQDRIKTCMKEHLPELSEPCKEGLFQAWLRQ